VLADFLAWLERWDPAGEGEGPRSDMTGLAPEARIVANEVLGEGEVSIQVAGMPSLRIQESVFTGLWRCCEFDAGGALRRDWLEAAPVPRVALERARAAASAALAPVEMPPGAMNSPALISEIASQLDGRTPGQRAHVVNLTLFPMTPDDHAVLERALPVGPVAMIRRFGNCRITSTTARDVWRVQYQQHEHADPQHHRGGRRPRGGAGLRRRPRRQPDAPRRARRLDGRVGRRAGRGPKVRKSPRSFRSLPSGRGGSASFGR
jgi:hydrogenase-1 operon protein HyaF